MGNGEFIDISGVAGLGFVQDGRSYSLVDLDFDGDLDMILKNRNAPQVRILRNQSEAGHQSIAFRLQGRQSNRDAVGATVTLETAAGVRTKQITLGSGYLSQSTKTLYFGLGSVAKVERVTIRWPSGQEQTFVDLPAGHRITVAEGEEKFRAEPFQSRNSDQRVCPAPEPLPAASRTGIAMLNRVPFPRFSLKDLNGRTVTHAQLEGRPTVLNFWATWCVPCQAEMKLWKEHYRQIRVAGAEIVALATDEPRDRPKVEQFVRERQLTFPVWLADAETLDRLNTFYKLLFSRAGDLALPTTFLLDKRGQVVKIYRGIIPIEALLADLDNLRNNPLQLAQSALPYQGRRFGSPFFRDYYGMAATFYEGGRVEETRLYLQRALELFPNNAEYWDRLGVLYARDGRIEEALKAFRRSVVVGPDHASAHFNLALTLARMGRIDQAEPAFARAAELDPADANKHMQHAVALAQRGNVSQAIRVMQRCLESEPGNAQAHYLLGRFYNQSGSRLLAMGQFEKATQVDPEFASAFRRLGMAYLQQNMPWRAVEALERALALDPKDTAGRFALANAYASMGRTAEAVRMLEIVLELEPGHAQARDALQRLRPPPPTAKRP